MRSLVRYQVEHSKRNFALAVRMRKLFGTFEKRARQTVPHSTQTTGEFDAQRKPYDELTSHPEGSRNTCIPNR